MPLIITIDEECAFAEMLREVGGVLGVALTGRTPAELTASMIEGLGQRYRFTGTCHRLPLELAWLPPALERASLSLFAEAASTRPRSDQGEGRGWGAA